MKESVPKSFMPEVNMMFTRGKVLKSSFLVEVREGQVVLSGRLLTPDADHLPERLDVVLLEISGMLKRRPVQVTFDLSYACTRSRGALLRFLIQLKELSAYSGYMTGLKVRWCCVADDDDMLELGELYQELSGIDMIYCQPQWTINGFIE